MCSGERDKNHNPSKWGGGGGPIGTGSLDFLPPVNLALILISIGR